VGGSHTTISEVYMILDDWLKMNLMSLNLIQFSYINFTARMRCDRDRDMGEMGTTIVRAINTKFLGLTIQNYLTWDHHIQNIIKKLNKACYNLSKLKPVVSNNALKIVYFSYFHTIMSYGIMFWGNSSQAERVFKLQKRAVRIMKRCGHRDSCRDHFKYMFILPLRSQYIYSLMMFITKNKDIFDINNTHYTINTRHIMDIHMSQVYLAIYGNGVFQMAVKIYSSLPNSLKEISKDIKRFKDNLREFLNHNSFYTLDEFFMR
jgi:hypothetical protein